MKRNEGMAGTARRAAASAVFALALGAAAPALAGERALADFIGFSENGRYFAFEEFGIRDGSGFPYSTIYVIDLANDTWVTGSPYRVQIEDEGASSLGKAREEAAELAAPKIADLGITTPADVIALLGDGEVSDGLTLDFAQPGYFPGETRDRYSLTLDLFAADESENCVAIRGEPGLGFGLTLTTKDDVAHEIHRDSVPLPKSRGCVTTYRIFAVVTPQYADPGQSGVAIISTYPVGFEGPDRRFIAVPMTY